jgi:hypothetical protein
MMRNHRIGNRPVNHREAYVDVSFNSRPAKKLGILREDEVVITPAVRSHEQKYNHQTTSDNGAVTRRPMRRMLSLGRHSQMVCYFNVGQSESEKLFLVVLLQ